jgi:elongator complex protein 1
MGTVDSGIHAMCWSPDQDLVVLVTGELPSA